MHLRGISYGDKVIASIYMRESDQWSPNQINPSKSIYYHLFPNSSSSNPLIVRQAFWRRLLTLYVALSILRQPRWSYSLTDPPERCLRDFGRWGILADPLVSLVVVVLLSLREDHLRRLRLLALSSVLAKFCVNRIYAAKHSSFDSQLRYCWTYFSTTQIALPR